jgi:SAM-dependent methyltransferase
MQTNNVCLIFVKKYLRGEILDVGATECSLAQENNLFDLQINSKITTLDIRQPTDIQHDLNNYPYPFRDNSFDTIFCLGTLEHLEAPYLVLKEFKRILKKEGILIIGLPNPHYIISKNNKDNRNYQYAYHMNLICEDTMRNCLSNLNFEIINRYCNWINPWDTLPIWLMKSNTIGRIWQHLPKKIQTDYVLICKNIK